MNDFLPVSKTDLKKRNWPEELDIILVSGDAYVDHPSYGASVIGRVLENEGFKVGIIAQPDCIDKKDFLSLGKPRLFFGVTAGNLDSMVANYTANLKVRKSDDYSPGGRSGLRPDRATIIYTNCLKELFKDVPIVIGGIEASLRRLAHYDYWSDKVRRSILLDSKADILVYGMGEKQIVEIARRLDSNEKIGSLNDIKGTVIIRNSLDGTRDYISIPSFEDVAIDKDKFNVAFKTVYEEADPFRGKTIVQQHKDRFVIQYPPAIPLKESEIDRIYELGYKRTWHPMYDKLGGVPGFETVRNSIISHRGCSGMCNFCSLYFHQGRIIQSRSKGSILREIEELARSKDFKGTITDVGGPTANLYKATCDLWGKAGACKGKSCLMPEKCKNLRLGYSDSIDLWKSIELVPKIKHVFVGSGIRYDLLVGDYADDYLKELCKSHISGQLKVAPEHVSKVVLKLMNKPSIDTYDKFVERFNKVNASLKRKQYLVNYFISAHPGAGLEEALETSGYLKKKGMSPEQVQDFLPLPMTASASMYFTGKNPFTNEKIYVPRGGRERRLQRALLQYKNPKNRKLIYEALKNLGKLDLFKTFLK